MSERDPTSYNLPERTCLSPEQIDNVGRALLTLMREMAVLQDRVMVLEELLAQADVVAPGAVDSFQPSEEFRERSAEAMRPMIDAVLASLQGSDGDS